MSHYKDWRPASLNVEAIASEAVLLRIEAKLDTLLKLMVANEPQENLKQINMETASATCAGTR